MGTYSGGLILVRLIKFLSKIKKIIANKAWVYIIVIEAQKFVFLKGDINNGY